MVNAVSAKPYSDVSVADFQHYFSGTAMAWRVSPQKSRLFIISEVSSSHIQGNYLTRLKELRPKGFLFNDWWNHLEILLPQPLFFNFDNGCGVWSPNIGKSTGGLKKSFPFVTNQIKFYGTVKPEEKTLQHLCLAAFPWMYSSETTPLTVREALMSGRAAVVSSEGFLIDQASKKFYYRRSIIGDIKDDKVILNYTARAFEPLLKTHGLWESEIKVAPIPEKKKPSPLGMHDPSSIWQNSPYPAPGWNTWYQVRCINPDNNEYGNYKVYLGVFSPACLMDGWKITKVCSLGNILPLWSVDHG